MKAKYLGLANPTKKKRRKKKKSSKSSKNTLFQSGIIDQDEENDNLNQVLGKRTQQGETLELEDFENMDEDEKPIFVETEESRKLTTEEKSKALKQIYGDSDEEGKINKSGKWVPVAEEEDPPVTDTTTKKLKSGTGVFEEDKIQRNYQNSPSPVQSDEDSDQDSSEEDDSSSEEEERVRHDSTDEEGDEEQIQLERGEREKLFKKKINAALGMEIKSQTASEKSSDSDIDSSDDDSDLDSGSDDDDEGKHQSAEATLAERLEQLKKKDEMMKKMAEQYKNAATVIRDQDGKKMEIKDLQASKEKKLEELNKAMLRQWKSGFKQRQDEISKRKMAEEGPGEGSAPMGGNIEGHMGMEQELEFMNKNRFDDPLKKKIKDQEEQYEGGYMQTLNCKFPGTPNRYGIQPGYMWDGVDRGSAFEKRFLQKMNEASNKVNKEYVEHARHL